MLLGGRCITPFLREGGSKLGGLIWKIKRNWRYGYGKVFLKRGGGAGIFPIQFFQGLSLLHLEITLSFAKFCYAVEEKVFFCHQNFMKRSF